MNQANYDQLRETQPYAPEPQRFEIDASVPKRSPWGCILGGCAGFFLLGLVFVCGIGYWGYSFYQGQLAKYTSETAVQLPSVDITQEETEAIEQRLEEFQQQFDDGEAPQEFVITLDEINALVAKNPDLKGRVYITIVDGKLRADVSFPTDQIPGGKGRYFNGSVTMQVVLSNGVLIATVTEAEANGLPVPEQMMTEIRRENLAKDMYKNPETAKALQRCESLTIEADRIILKVREKPLQSTDAQPVQEPANTATEPTQQPPPEVPDSK